MQRIELMNPPIVSNTRWLTVAWPCVMALIVGYRVGHVCIKGHDLWKARRNTTRYPEISHWMSSPQFCVNIT